jgi:hypothetical protein
MHDTGRVIYGPEAGEKLRELLAWINASESHTLRFDPEPVEYEPHDIVSMAEEIKKGRIKTFGGTKRYEFNIGSIRFDGVIIVRIGNGDESKLSYRDLCQHHVWQDDNTPVARRKRDGNEST